MPGTPCQTNNSCEVREDLQLEDLQNLQANEPARAPLPPQEITQTDRLNKRLLVSFLNRLNSQSVVEPQPKSDDNSDDMPFQ